MKIKQIGMAAKVFESDSEHSVQARMGGGGGWRDGPPSYMRVTGRYPESSLK